MAETSAESPYTLPDDGFHRDRAAALRVDEVHAAVDTWDAVSCRTGGSRRSDVKVRVVRLDAAGSRPRVAWTRRAAALRGRSSIMTTLPEESVTRIGSATESMMRSRPIALGADLGLRRPEPLVIVLDLLGRGVGGSETFRRTETMPIPMRASPAVALISSNRRSDPSVGSTSASSRGADSPRSTALRPSAEEKESAILLMATRAAAFARPRASRTGVPARSFAMTMALGVGR